MKQFFSSGILVALLFQHFASAHAQVAQGAHFDLVQPEMEFNSLLMESTFKIEGPSARGPAVGTGFVLGKRSLKRPGEFLTVLVTANHVLADIEGSNANLVLRRPKYPWTSKVFTNFSLQISGSNVTVSPPPMVGFGVWDRTNFTLQIRNLQTNLWLKHPKQDLAGMVVHLPAGCVRSLATTDIILTEDVLRDWEIHPGDRLSCLGYPLGLEANATGFPILRTGTISSYPLYPIDANPTFLFEFKVFGGNSGGPVYFIEANRFYGGGVRISQVNRGLAGVVVAQLTHDELTTTLVEKRLTTTPFEISVVVQGQCVKELIDMLPEE